MLTRENNLISFLQSQKTIRVIIDDAGNFGNQAASYNLIARIKQLGFNGKFEVVYFDDAKEKIIKLFCLTNTGDDRSFLSETHNIHFIGLSDFILKSIRNEIEPIEIGISGAIDESPDEWGDNFAKDKNFATLLNVDCFVRFSPHYNNGMCDTEIYLRNNSSPIIQHTCNKTLITPIPTLLDVKNFLAENPIGKSLSEEQPALKTLIEKIENKTINFQPIYGWTLRESPSNLLNIILGARYAQLHGGEEFKKPLVIGAFFDFDRENKFIKFNYDRDIKNIDIFCSFFNPNLETIFKHYPGGEKAKAAIKKLKLKNALHISEIRNKNTKTLLDQINEKNILLVSFPSLPKIVFDALYSNHHNLPAVREGASSFTTLITNSNPHLHCRSDMPWEILNKKNNKDLLYKKLKKINQLICKENYGMDLNFSSWEKYPIDEIIGKFIISARQKNSILSKFFHDFQKNVTDPSNDRILLDLSEAANMLTTLKKQEACRKENGNAIHDNQKFNHEPESTIFIENNLNVIKPSDELLQFHNPSSSTLLKNGIFNAFLQWLEKSYDDAINAAQTYANGVVRDCPSYFPPQYPGTFWQPQSEFLTKGKENNVCLLNSTLNPSSITPPLLRG